MRRLAWPLAASLLLLAAVLLVVRATALARRTASPPPGRYATGVVERGNIEVTVSGTGTVAFADRRAVFPEVDGVVASVLVQPGDQVRQGQPLLVLANDSLVAARDVTAPTSGIIADLRVKEGDLVQQGAVLAHLADAEYIDFVALVLAPERARIRPGQAAGVAVDDFSGEVAGTVLEVGEEPLAGDYSPLYEVRIGLKNPGLYREGMTGQATILADGGPVVRRGTVRWRARQALTAPMAGRVESLAVTAGQRVPAGKRIARIANATWSEADLRDKLTLRAPIDGVVVAVNVRPGEPLAPSGKTGTGAAPVEPVVVASRDVLVTVKLDEMDVARVQPGQQARVSLPALEGKLFVGRVEGVALEGSTQNGVTSYDVRIRLEQPEGVLAGMTATASILVAAKEGALLVPAEAVNSTPKGPVVRVLEAGVPRPVPVRLGLRNDRVVEVLSGLQEGQRVVLAEAAPQQGVSPAAGRGGPGAFPGPGLMGPLGGFRGPGGPARGGGPR